MQVQARAGRFHGAGSWPPTLSTILREVDRVYMRQGYFTSAKEFRGVCTSADGSYTKGAADDCMRLLKNAGALIPGVVGGRSRLLIDQTACATLESCFERNEQPPFPSLGELAKRLPILLRALRRRTSKPKQTTKPTIAPVAATAELSSTDVELSSTSVAPSQPTETQMIATAPAPAVSTGRAHKPVPVPRFVAYLPSGAACEVWLFLYVCVTQLKDFGARIAVPISKLPDGVVCSTAEFDEWLEAFASAGVIERLGESGGDNDAFRALIHPDEIHTVEIKEKLEVRVSRIWIDLADRARAEIGREDMAPDRLRHAIAAVIRKNCQAVHPGTAREKLVGYKPESRSTKNWGIFYQPADSPVYVPCLPGLEPYAFVPMDDAPERRTRHKPTKAQVKAAAESQTDPAPAPVAAKPVPAVEPEPATPVEPEPAVESEPQPEPIAAAAPSQDLHAWISEEIRRLVEAERLLTAKLARERRHAELAAELATLDTQIAADNSRLAELGFPVPKED